MLTHACSLDRHIWRADLRVGLDKLERLIHLLTDVPGHVGVDVGEQVRQGGLGHPGGAVQGLHDLAVVLVLVSVLLVWWCVCCC